MGTVESGPPHGGIPRAKLFICDGREPAHPHDRAVVEKGEHARQLVNRTGEHDSEAALSCFLMLSLLKVSKFLVRSPPFLTRVTSQFPPSLTSSSRQPSSRPYFSQVSAQIFLLNRGAP